MAQAWLLLAHLSIKSKLKVCSPLKHMKKRIFFFWTLQLLRSGAHLIHLIITIHLPLTRYTSLLRTISQQAVHILILSTIIRHSSWWRRYLKIPVYQYLIVLPNQKKDTQILLISQKLLIIPRIDNKMVIFGNKM